MSYVRPEKGKSSLYIVDAHDGEWECIACDLVPPTSYEYEGREIPFRGNYKGRSLDEMLEHMENHRLMGHNVDPEDVRRIQCMRDGVEYKHPDEVLMELADRLTDMGRVLKLAMPLAYATRHLMKAARQVGRMSSEEEIALTECCEEMYGLEEGNLWLPSDLDRSD